MMLVISAAQRRKILSNGKSACTNVANQKRGHKQGE
jgi:hypothetical protein